MLAAAVDDSAFAKVVRCKLNGDLVTRQYTNVILAHFSGDMRSHNVTIFEFYPKSRVGQRLVNDAFHLNGFFFRQGSRFSLVLKGR